VEGPQGSTQRAVVPWCAPPTGQIISVHTGDDTSVSTAVLGLSAGRWVGNGASDTLGLGETLGGQRHWQSADGAASLGGGLHLGRGVVHAALVPREDGGHAPYRDVTQAAALVSVVEEDGW
jgi:hypothetical protein